MTTATKPRGPRNPAPITPFPLQGDRTTPRPIGTIRTTGGATITVVKHKHPDFPSRNRYDVTCDACGPLATYEAQAYGNDYSTQDGCDEAARRDALGHASDHARTCPGVPARPRKAGRECSCHGTEARA
jgi:hypothetical protein